jgi:hypothetical protein
MSWVYEAVGWLIVVAATFNAGWDLASLAVGRTTLRGRLLERRGPSPAHSWYRAGHHPV